MTSAFQSNFKSHLLAFGCLALLTAAMFGDVFWSRGQILSTTSSDVALLYYHWRGFGFDQLRHGHLALWNPYSLCGCPFFGDFQSGLLYPFNLPYLFLPLPVAINFDFAFHIFLSGWWMYFWARRRGLSWTASLLSGALLMFSGPLFSRIFAGHLGPIAVLAWTPLVFWACEDLLQGRAQRGVLLGMTAVAMQILAGYPQFLVYTLEVAALYSALRLSFDSSLCRAAQLKACGGFLAIYAGGAALGAVQLLAGASAAAESVRGGGTSYEIASTFALAPENLLTLLAPYFFSNSNLFEHWGQTYFWETSLFLGVTGLSLALLGWSRAPRRERMVVAVCVLICLVLALGKFTPLFGWLYRFAPGFSSFRGSAKYGYFVTLLLALYAGIGWDALKSSSNLDPDSAPNFAPNFNARWAATGVLLAATLGAVGWAIHQSGASGGDGFWGAYLQWTARTREVFLPRSYYSDADFIVRSAQWASLCLWAAALTALMCAACFGAARCYPRACHVLACLAVLEVMAAAHFARATFDASALVNPQAEAFYAPMRGDFRVLKQAYSNTAMTWHVHDIHGYDPMVSRRYSEFLNWTQGNDLQKAGADFAIRRTSPFLALLRCRYILLRFGTQVKVTRSSGEFPHLLLLHEYSLAHGQTRRELRDNVLSRLGQSSFDPRREVVLEAEPSPEPVAPPHGAAPESARIVANASDSTDALTIEAEVSSPAILLVTDSYSRDWRARPLPLENGSMPLQREYSVLPADWTLRAIPLQPGRHRLRLEYVPRGFILGQWISIVAWLALLAAMMISIMSIRAKRAPTTERALTERDIGA